MKLKTKSEIYRKLRGLFNVMIGIGYLMLSYLLVLIAFTDGNLHDSSLPIIVIALCSMGQISQYYNAYRQIPKGPTYYIGIVPPSLALLSLIFAVTKTYLSN